MSVHAKQSTSKPQQITEVILAGSFQLSFSCAHRAIERMIASHRSAIHAHLLHVPHEIDRRCVSAPDMYQPGERNDEEDAKSDEDMDLLRGGCIDQVRVGIRLGVTKAMAQFTKSKRPSPDLS